MSKKELENSIKNLEEILMVSQKFAGILIRLGGASDEEKMLIGWEMMRRGLELFKEGATPR